MQTRSSSKFVGEPSTNPTSTNPKRRNRRRSKQRVEPFALGETPVVTMADQRNMEELFRAPTEGYAEAIVVPPIPAEHFELKHSLIKLVTSKQLFSFTELHQLDTFYNGLNPSDQDSLNSAAGGNILEKMAKLTDAVTQQTSDVTSAMTAMMKQHQATTTPASVKAVEESCVTCGGAHCYRQCPATDGNTFSGYQDNIQGYVSAAAVNYNQGNTGYRPQSIKQRIQTARDRQKSYADLKRKPIEFQVGDKVMLKVSPWKGVVHFRKQGKLNPRYVRPFKVLKKFRAVAYKLELPQELSRVHNTFHVSNLKKCYSDDPLFVPLEGLQVDDKLYFVEEPVEIMNREVKQLRRIRVPIVKVRWNSRRGPEFTWERKDQFRKKYPHLFTKIAPSSSAVS
ncbi:putative reverse transcriptase domain-containing protein [Tanacetum coccineum]|uniref:Reverse transcriptase domain-containing protein n=1 Tax=Tanacetum coccineum TaxID=301880 RepID=A0ABQ4YTY9_9ASTR